MDPLVESPERRTRRRPNAEFMSRFSKPVDSPGVDRIGRLGDAGAQPLHLTSPFTNASQRALKDRHVDAERPSAWGWSLDQPLPALPHVVPRHGRNQ